jgi:replicative DNA helicase
VSQANLYIDDTSGISPYEIRAKCRRLKAQKGLDMIMVDYLQIMDLKKPVESRERAVAEISKTLKAIAKELDVPVIALAQLNRGVEGRTGGQRKPMLSDLRESGSIEQDADVIMMLYREEYYDRNNPDVKGQATVVVGKHRNGPTGEINLTWKAEVGQFENPVDDGGGGPMPPMSAYEEPSAAPSARASKGPPGPPTGPPPNMAPV